MEIGAKFDSLISPFSGKSYTVNGRSVNGICDLLQALPDDVLVTISRFLHPRDVCNLSFCCRSLNWLAVSDKVWLAQCQQVQLIGTQDLIEWRKGVSCYKALCRFLLTVKPLIGIWVHQNPELGNVVYVMWGYISVVGCRIIPQEIGPLGFESPLLWAPVFEVICDSDGSLVLFLHGRERDCDYCYPGSMKQINKDCNVLLLEAEPKQRQSSASTQEEIMNGRLLHTRSAHHLDRELSGRRICRSETKISKSQRITTSDSIAFSRLAFSDRRKLLELVAGLVRLELPRHANGPLFPRLRGVSGQEDDLSMAEEGFQKDILLLSERRLLLIKKYKLGGVQNGQEGSGLVTDGVRLDVALKALGDSVGPLDVAASKEKLSEDSGRIKKSLDQSSGWHPSFNGRDCSQRAKRKTIGGYFKDGLKQILGRSTSVDGSVTLKNSPSSSDNKHVHLHEFLRLGNMIGLCLRASTMKLTTYRAWPNMHDNRFALYKLPERVPVSGQEYAGLWGGTFGWPPGQPSEDKPEKALFFLLLSYEEVEEGKLLIATKILEGTHYVLHPNGSAMFVVKVNELSLDPFPWDKDQDSCPVDIKQAYHGEGIANGYGFRYPGSKPGALYVFEDGLLAFVWKETRKVLTLQRLDLQALLKKGERVSALTPVANFAYLTKSYSNVFTGFSSNTTGFSLPRFIAEGQLLMKTLIFTSKCSSANANLILICRFQEWPLQNLKLDFVDPGNGINKV